MNEPGFKPFTEHSFSLYPISTVLGMNHSIGNRQ